MTGRWTWHGGGLAAARAHFGEGDAPWIDLSTGINPHAWPGANDTPVDWKRLPDEAGLRALEQAAAAHFGADPDLVCALPGTEIGLRLLGSILPGPAQFVAPSYRTHGAMFGSAAPTTFDAASGTLILANPNNPDGRTLSRERLLRYADWLIVDEAFADCDHAESVARDVAERRRLIVFRSFGKFFGLAGLRLGFVIAPRSIADRFREKLGAWPVSAAAIAIGVRAYRDAAWIASMRSRLAEEAQRLDAVLAGRGYSPMGACPLFRLIETADAAGLFERLARRAILTRPFDYAPNWLRIGLPPDSQALARLDEALADG